MKLVRISTGADGESHIERMDFDFSERAGTRTVPQRAAAVTFAHRADGSFSDFHTPPQRLCYQKTSSGRWVDPAGVHLKAVSCVGRRLCQISGLTGVA